METQGRMAVWVQVQSSGKIPSCHGKTSLCSIKASLIGWGSIALWRKKLTCSSTWQGKQHQWLPLGPSAFSGNGKEHKWDGKSKTGMVPRPSIGPEALANGPRADPVCPVVTRAVLEAGSVLMLHCASPNTLQALLRRPCLGSSNLNHAGSWVVAAPTRSTWPVTEPQVGVGTGCLGSLGDSCLTATPSPSAKGRRWGWMEVMP